MAFTELNFSINSFDLGTLQKSNGKLLFIHTQKEGKDPIKFLFHKSSLNSHILLGAQWTIIHKINILLIVSNKCRTHCQWSVFGPWVFRYEKLPIVSFLFLDYTLISLKVIRENTREHETLWSSNRKRPRLLPCALAWSRIAALTGGDRGKRWGLKVKLETWAGELKIKMDLMYASKVIQFRG